MQLGKIVGRLQNFLSKLTNMFTDHELLEEKRFTESSSSRTDMDIDYMDKWYELQVQALERLHNAHKKEKGCRLTPEMVNWLVLNYHIDEHIEALESDLKERKRNKN